VPGFQNFNERVLGENPVVSEKYAYDAFLASFMVKYMEFFSIGD